MESKVWATSDLHFNHDRIFIYEPRGFKSVHEMNETIVRKWNEVVGPTDDVYVLGDLMLGDNEIGLSLIKQLKGRIHIIRGNHDTDTRMKLYPQCYNVEEITEGQYLKYKKYHFYLSHFPTITSNFDDDKPLKARFINLYGHTHQNTNFYNDNPCVYHVGVDSHDCYPVSFDKIIEDINNKNIERRKYER